MPLCLHGGWFSEAELGNTRKLTSVLASSLFCIAGFRLAATAQVQTYSADSLMATFEKGSRHSLKGAEITFNDVVIERRSSKVFFKASNGDRVICDLASLTGNNTPHVSIGSLITVTGKVKGRGVLGNVTLDDCNVPPVAASGAAVAPDAILHEQTSIPVDVVAVVSEEPALVAPPVGRPQEPPKEVVPTGNVQQEPPRTAAITDKPVPLEGVEHPSVQIGHDHNVPRSTQEVADFTKRDIPYALYVLLFLSGAAATSVLSNILIPAFRKMQFWKPASPANTPETRQAALEALLLKSAKKR
jgi:hypothetical protein